MGLLQLFFPTYCILCKTRGSYICTNCFVGISYETSSLCVACGGVTFTSLTHTSCQKKYVIDGIFCGVVYKGIIKKLVYQFKYPPYLSDLQSTLGNLLYESLIQQEQFHKALQQKPIFIPIPLTKKRMKKRGYNQAGLLARFLSKKFQLPYKDLLIRKKETKPQYGLQKAARKENMQDAFAFSGKYVPEAVFLVDDILTTGSTFAEAAKTLKKAGVTYVWGIAFARDQL